VHDFGYCPLRPSEGFRQTGRLAHSRPFPSSASQLPNPVAGAVQLARYHSQILQGNAPGRGLVMILPPQISPGPRNQDGYDMCCGKGETHQDAPKASFTCGTWGTARQKPGRVVVRHFCDWPLCCNEGRLCPRRLSLQSALQCEAVMVRRRGGLREGLDAVELVTRPMRGGHVRGPASQLLSSIEAGVGDRGFWLKLPRTSLARSPSAAAWPIRGAWRGGVGF
jgi:hypothetical protein